MNFNACVACQCLDDEMWKYFGCPNCTCKSLIRDIAKSDESALKFANSDDSCASLIPENIFISCEDMETYRKLKDDIESKTAKELYAEACEKWNKPN